MDRLILQRDADVIFLPMGISLPVALFGPFVPAYHGYYMLAAAWLTSWLILAIAWAFADLAALIALALALAEQIVLSAIYNKQRIRYLVSRGYWVRQGPQKLTPDQLRDYLGGVLPQGRPFTTKGEL